MTYPSTEKQLVLLRLLADELRDLGLTSVALDRHGYVTAAVPSSLPSDGSGQARVPVVGLLAHVDTSPSVSAANVRPQVIRGCGGWGLRQQNSRRFVDVEAALPGLHGAREGVQQGSGRKRTHDRFSWTSLMNTPVVRR